MASLDPEFSRAALVPELLVSDLAASLRFWCGLCGFTVAYNRPEEQFAYLDRAGCQVMLEGFTQEGDVEPGRRWLTGPMERPLGRGINLQMAVADLDPILTALDAAAWPLYLGPEVRWYRAADRETGVRQALVQDPDGYLLRFSQPLGERDRRE